MATSCVFSDIDVSLSGSRLAYFLKSVQLFPFPKQRTLFHKESAEMRGKEEKLGTVEKREVGCAVEAGHLHDSLVLQ